MWITKKQWQELWGHITTTNHELGEVQKQTKDLPVMRADIKWLKWLVCAVFLGMVLGLLKQFLGI